MIQKFKKYKIIFIGIKTNKYLYPYENAVFCVTITETNGIAYKIDKQNPNK